MTPTMALALRDFQNHSIGYWGKGQWTFSIDMAESGDTNATKVNKKEAGPQRPAEDCP